jgi:hypothetical protein
MRREVFAVRVQREVFGNQVVERDRELLVGGRPGRDDWVAAGGASACGVVSGAHGQAASAITSRGQAGKTSVGSVGRLGSEKLGSANPNVGSVGNCRSIPRFRLKLSVGSVGRLGRLNDGSANANVGSVGSWRLMPRFKSNEIDGSEGNDGNENDGSANPKMMIGNAHRLTV